MLAQKLLSIHGPAAVNPPAYVDHVTHAGTAEGNLTIDLSALDMQSGDVLLVFAGSDITSSYTPSCSTLTLLEGALSPCHYLGWTTVGASPPSSVTVNNIGQYWVTLAMSFRYCTYENHGMVSGFHGMPNCGEITVQDANSLIVLIGRLDDDVVTSTPPSTFSEIVDITHGSTGGGGSLMVATKTAGATGALNPAAWGGSGSDDWLAFNIELSPS